MRKSEWWWVGGLSGLLLTLLVVTLASREPSLAEDRAHYLTAPLTVTVSGAVSHPGTYTLPAGSNVEDLLKLAEPLPGVKLKGISKRKKLVQHQHLNI